MDGKKMAYARVSSSSQNLARQIEELKQYVDEANIVVDKASGKDLNRSGFQALKGPLGLRKDYQVTGQVKPQQGRYQERIGVVQRESGSFANFRPSDYHDSVTKRSGMDSRYDK